MITEIKEKAANIKGAETLSPADSDVSPKAAKNQPRSLPFVTLWQDENGVIQVKLGNGINPINAIALLELGIFTYKVSLLPSISPRPVQAPEGSEPSQGSVPKN